MAIDIIEKLGGNSKVATALSVEPNVVANWKLRGKIPMQQRFRIAKLAADNDISLPDGFLPTVGL